MWYYIVPFAVVNPANVYQKLYQSRSLKGRDGVVEWVTQDCLTELKKKKQERKGETTINGALKNNEISRGELPTTVTFGRECSQLVSVQQGEATGTQFLDFIFFVHFLCCFAYPTMAECKLKRVRKLGECKLKRVKKLG